MAVNVLIYVSPPSQLHEGLHNNAAIRQPVNVALPISGGAPNLPWALQCSAKLSSKLPVNRDEENTITIIKPLERTHANTGPTRKKHPQVRVDTLAR